jgi:hypothetical protein
MSSLISAGFSSQGTPGGIHPSVQNASDDTGAAAERPSGAPAKRGFQHDSFGKRWPLREKRRASKERPNEGDHGTPQTLPAKPRANDSGEAAPQTVAETIQSSLSGWYEQSFLHQAVEHIGRALEDSRFANIRKDTLKRRVAGRRPSREQVEL